MARLMWPTDGVVYDDVWDPISDLGDVEHNPIGMIYFQITLTIMGILAFITLFTIHPILMKMAEKTIEENANANKNLKFFEKLNQKRKNVIWGSFWLLMSSIGLLLTGLIPSEATNIDRLHENTSILGLVGMILAAWHYWGPLRVASKTNQKILLLSAFLWWGIMILSLGFYIYASEVIADQYDLGWVGPAWREAGINPIFSFSIWEKVIFAYGYVYFGLLIYLVRDHAIIEDKQQ